MAFEFIEKLGAPFYASTTATSPPKASSRIEQEPRRRRQGPQGRAAAHRHQAALGHGQPVQQPALHARRGHQPQRRRLRLRRRAGEEGAWKSPTSSAARATPSGAAAKATQRSEHRHEARARPPRRGSSTWPSTTRSRSASQGPFYIEPKPKEPTKHQYDSDAAACLNFLPRIRSARRTSSSTSRPTTPRSPATR